MSRRRRARLIVVSVALIATATVASGNWVVTTNPADGGSGSAMQTLRIVISVRNTDPTMATAMLGKPMTSACMPITVTDIDGNVAPAWSIAGKQQKQLILTALYSTTGTQSCMWTINSGPGMGTFGTTFSISGTHPPYSAQPRGFDFAVSGVPSETQYGIVQNLSGGSGSYANVVIQENTGGTTMSIVAPGEACDGTQSCPGQGIGPNAFDKIGFKCTPGASPAMGNIQWQFGGSMPPIDVPFVCARAGMPPLIDITQPQITLQGAVNGTATGTASVMSSGVDSIASATITGTDASAFRLTMPSPQCNGGTSCTWSPAMPIGAGIPLAIECSPGTVQKTARLRVVGTAHADDLDEADLSCVADSGASVNPTSLAFGDVKVTTTSAPQMFAIENLSGTQPVSVTVDTGHPDWLANACVTSACSIPANGTQMVEVRFKPSVPAQNDRTLSVAVGGMQVAAVALTGNGAGSRLRVLDYAAPYVIDLGAIGLNTTRKRTVRLEADGNRSLNVGIGTPATPFSTSTQAVDIAAGAQGMFDVSCSSTMPGTFTGMVTLAPGPMAHVYASDTDKLDVKCRVANTPVEVLPDSLDFGEVLRNTQPPSFEIQIHNPSASPISLDHVRLTNPTALTITQPTDMTLDPDETITATLTLATTAEVTVQSALEVGVGGNEELVTPITGKVVTASARVTPTSLKLGSVCVGAAIDEPVKLVNDGTATLHAFPPLMDTPFSVSYVNPVSYPMNGALLGPTEEATAAVRLSTASSGTVSGKLMWDVTDAPGAPFVIDASVEVKDTGTAVSPQAIAFDEIRVDERSDRRTVRVQNCGDFNADVEVLGVTASHSRPDAWEVTPARAKQTLRPGERLTIDVRFAPTKPGLHVAAIQLDVEGMQQEIELTGEAIGDSVERTSLYACSCNVPGAPWQGLPIVIVVVCVAFRRRRAR